MKKLIDKIKEELVIKLDFVNNEFEIGWVWFILQMPSFYLLIREITIMLIKNY